MRRGTALVLTLAVAGVFLSPPRASAQGGLVASSPGPQAILSSAPATVELVFSAAPILDGSHVTVLAPDGAEVRGGDLTAGTGLALRRSVSIDTSGDFTVAYHVELDGGGESSGSLRFSVGTGAPPAAADRAVAEAAAAAQEGHGHGVDPVGATLLVVDGLVVLVVLALLYLRRPYQPGGRP